MLCRVRALILAGWQELPTWCEQRPLREPELPSMPVSNEGVLVLHEVMSEEDLRGIKPLIIVRLQWLTPYCLLVQMVKHLPAIQETQVQPLGREDTLNKGMTTHSSILAWIISWTVELGRLQSMGSQKVGHDWVTNPHTLACQMRPWGEAK